MIDESVNISVRTWTQTAAYISKVGYSDGVTDGQNASFQKCFDMGYSQGLKFGLHLGYKLAMQQHSNVQSDSIEPTDSSRINCQICLDPSIISHNVFNLFNNQKENNDEFLIKQPPAYQINESEVLKCTQ